MGFLLIFVLVLLFGAKKFMEVGFFFVGLMWVISCLVTFFSSS